MRFLRKNKNAAVKIILFWIWCCGVFGLYAQTGDYLSRIHAWEQKPASGEKFLQLARLYEQTGNYRKAVENYRQALGFYPDSVPLIKQLAIAYERYGHLDKAVSLREQIDTADMTNAYRLALLYARTNRKKQALKLLYRLEKKDTANAEYSYRIGLYEIDMNRKLDAFLRAYRKDTMHIKSIRMIVRYYRILKYRDSTDYFIAKGLRAAPYDTGLLRLKVVEAFRRKNYRQMLVDLDKLDSLHYDPLFVNKNRGAAWIFLGDTDKARRYLQKAAAVDFQDPGVHYYLGLLYEKLKRFDKARQEFLIAVKLKKPVTDKEYLHLGLIAKEQKNYAEAIRWLKKARENNHKNAEALFQLAVISELYYKDKSIALEYYERYLEQFGEEDKERMPYVKARISALKKELFFNKEKDEREE